jgi:leucyl-tRNA synthetase
MVNSGQFDGMSNDEGKTAIAEFAEMQGWGQRMITYRLRDWLISRQRAWGTPIPMIYCEADGIVPVPEDQLPVRLPDDAEFLPTGKSPLARHEGFVNVACPKCGKPARRETDTMDTFMDSNWYFIRYLSPDYDKGPVDPELSARWLPVDQYTGGAEHAVMHLLYARFFWKVARDLGVVQGPEPFLRLFNQGQILGPDGQRMSKSRGNVVAPDDQVSKWGADCFRCYLMFIGPWEEGGPFRIDGIPGIERWLNRAWSVALSEPAFGDAGAAAVREMRRLTHKTLRRVTEDFNGFRWNTAISGLMEMVNGLSKAREGGAVDRDAWHEAIETMVLMMAPLAPHIAEELWERTDHPYSVHLQAWPEWDAELAREDEITLVVQVNGKVRDRISAPADISEEAATKLALASEAVKKHMDGKSPRLVKYVPGKLINIVV